MGYLALSDDSAVSINRAATEARSERIEQIQMLSEWRASLGSELELSVKVACEAISSMSHLSPNENGMADLKRWVKKFGIDDVIRAIDISFPQYIRFSDNLATEESWELAFRAIPGVITNQRKASDNPNHLRILYCMGILRKRFGRDDRIIYDLMEEACDLEMDIEWAVDFAKRARSHAAFKNSIINFIDEEIEGN